MSTIIKVNGVAVSNVKREFPLNERLDEELDSGVLVIVNKRSTVYDPMSKVEVFITSEVTPDHIFLVDSDECVLTARDLGIYQHTISLIEPTKVLERVYVDNLAFTQPTDGSSRYTLGSALERIQAVTPLEQQTLHSATRLFEFDSGMLADLEDFTVPQLYFSQQHVRQVADEMLKTISSVARVRSYSSTTPIVVRDDFNALVGVISGASSVDAKTNASEYFINEFDMQVDNGIGGVVEVFPEEPLWVSLTTEDYIVTTNDLIIKLPKPAYKIEKVEMFVRYTAGDVNSKPTNIYKTIDITSYVYEEDLYNLLSINDKRYAIIWKKGNREIKGFGVAYPQLFGLFPTTVLSYVYAEQTPISYETPTSTTYTYNASPTFNGDSLIKGEYGFRVYYYPYTSQRLRVHKSVPVSNNRYHIAANQSAKALDITRLLDNAQGTINRLGNGDYMIEKVVTDYANRYKVGQYTNDGRIVTSVENIVNDGYYRSKAVLTKNFNRLSQFVGVDREYRQYNLPLNETVNRNLYYEEFVTFSPVPQSLSTPSWSSSSIAWLRYMFDYTQHTNYWGKSIKHIVVNTKNTSKVSFGKFLVGNTKNYHRNSISFHFTFETNKIAFYYPSDTIETPVSGVNATALTPVFYTDDDGVFEYMDFSLLGDDYFKSANELVRNVDDIDSTGFAFIMASFPNGLIHHFTNTPYTYTDPVSLETYDYDYALLTPSGGSFTASPMLEEDVLAELYTKDYTSTNLVFNGVDYKFKLQGRLVADEFTNPSNYAAKLTDLIVKKDPSEVISMTYQLHFVPLDARVVLGRMMMERNPYLVERVQFVGSGTNLYLYRGSARYRDGDSVCKGTPLGTPFTGYSQTSYTNGFVLQVSASMVGYNSWAIGDGNGNLYVGCNRDASALPTDIFVQFKNKL